MFRFPFTLVLLSYKDEEMEIMFMIALYMYFFFFVISSHGLFVQAINIIVAALGSGRPIEAWRLLLNFD